MTRKPRLFYLDLVRVVALLCILVIHFNASVTGYFSYPSKLFVSWLPGGIYLGDFGSSLFFIVSGAALMYTAPAGFTAKSFYQKRARAVYPMFWLAWVICFSLRFLRQPGYYAGAKTITLVLTVLGLDNFAAAAGIVSMDFACVGEWFLGSILFLYLLFPLLKKCLERHRLLTWLVVLALCIPVHLLGWERQLVAIHIPEFLFGMTVVTRKKANPTQTILAALVWPALYALTRFAVVDSKILCAGVSMAVFVMLMGVADWFAKPSVCRICSLLSRYSYAVFLVHHVLILRMVQGFDLSQISRRDTALLFCVYLAGTAAAAYALFHLDSALRKRLHGVFSPTRIPNASVGKTAANTK
jgi:peptidoglycan/LPS O-acetylase OafA/YrhL